MFNFDASSGECLVLVFREGLLSTVGHDLKIRVTEWKMWVDQEKRHLRAELNPSSLKVVSAGPSRSDAEKIEESIRRDVLDVAQYPVIKLSAQLAPEGSGFRFDGTIQLHGREKRIRGSIVQGNNRLETEVWLDQRDFGIRIFSALFGALRVKPEVGISMAIQIKPSRSTPKSHTISRGRGKELD